MECLGLEPWVAGKSTELWRHPRKLTFNTKICIKYAKIVDVYCNPLKKMNGNKLFSKNKP